MKLKVTVNGEAYDIDVEVEEPDAPRLGAIVIGGVLLATNRLHVPGESADFGPLWLDGLAAAHRALHAAGAPTVAGSAGESERGMATGRTES